MRKNKDFINPEDAGNLHGLFKARVGRTPDATAYRFYNRDTLQWESLTWRECCSRVSKWQHGLRNENLEPGDRVALMLNNSVDWIVFEQAALSLGLVVVPLYVDDRADNIAYILNDSGAKLLLIDDTEHWQKIFSVASDLETVQRIVALKNMSGQPHDSRLRESSDWLPAISPELHDVTIDNTGLATVVYTSGTTGRPKGVKLTHDNILYNTWYGLQSVSIYPEDEFLSFLPLSHMFERTAGYYIPLMAGATVAYARSIPELAEDLQTIKPTVLVSVPRIFERVYNKIMLGLEAKPGFVRKLFHKAVDTGWKHFEFKQGRGHFSPAFLVKPVLDTLVGRKVMAKLGGRMRLAILGGAAMPPAVAQTFIGLGLNILQGYGLTETSPIISVNMLSSNYPDSVGQPLQGVEIMIGDDDELLTRGVCVMEGYWNRETDIIDDEGWLHTGDKVRIENNHIYITGRIKEIIVMSNGEKVPPADIEMAITLDPLFEQAMVIGEGRPFMTALLVPEPGAWTAFCTEHGIDESDRDSAQLQSHLTDRLHELMKQFPGYASIKRAAVTDEPWTIDNGMLTPTLKLKRNEVTGKYADLIEELYKGH